MGSRVDLGGMQRRALLTILLLNANHVVSVDRLTDELWGETPPPTAAHTIQVYVSQLRKLFAAAGETLVTQRPGYVLRVEADQLDLNRFEQFLAEGRAALTAGDADTAAATLQGSSRALARRGSRRLQLRAVRGGGDRPARRPASRCAGGPHRGRPPARPSPRR